MQIGRGDRTIFWEDQWTLDSNLANKFPRLFNISLNKYSTVKEVIEGGLGVLRFRRVLTRTLGELKNQMNVILADVVFTDEPDRLIWKPTGSGIFSVKYFYSVMQFRRMVPYRFMWRVKIPLRVKTFL